MAKQNSFYSKYGKRIVDLIISIPAIILISPVIMVVAFLVKIKLGSPVIFSQLRPGKDGKIFRLYKFRTMTDKRDESGELLEDKYRLTSFGKKLRASSLDELPELINIIKGDMSLVGPRPLLVEYLNLYTKEESRRHDVRPGLTGLAQISGRNAISWDDKFNLDVEYVDNVSLIRDWKIIFLTLKKVFVKEGISSDTSVTMEPFRGSKVEN